MHCTDARWLYITGVFSLIMIACKCIYSLIVRTAQDRFVHHSPTVQDRFADARALPPVDNQQDWTLVAGKEENGWTIVAFNRTLHTRDTRDRDIVQVCMHAQAV